MQPIVTKNGQRKTTLKRRRPHATGRRGAAMAELAIVTPLLFFSFLAAFEFCRVAMIRQTVDNAVYEGCRQALVPGTTVDEVRDAAENVLGTIGLTGAVIEVSPKQLRGHTGDVTVDVTLQMDGSTFVPPQFVGGATITRTLTMRRD